MGLGVVGISETENFNKRVFADVLSDFDLRPSWALAVALKEVVRDEMKRAWHSDGEAEDGIGIPAAAAICDDAEAASKAQADDGALGRCQRKFVPEQQDMVRAVRPLYAAFNHVPAERHPIVNPKPRGVLPCASLLVQESPAACLLSGSAAACFNALRQRSDLIVIASLVTKAPNLGGLARTCEVFNTR